MAPPARGFFHGAFWGGLGVGLLAGVLFGAAGAYAVWIRDPGRSPVASEAPPAALSGSAKRPTARKREPSPSRPGDDNPVVLSADDTRILAEGDVLRPRPRSLDLGDPGWNPGSEERQGPEGRDLTQAEIDRTLESQGGSIMECIEEARGRAELSSRVRLGFVVGAGGSVSQARVEAPAYLMRRGLYRCARAALRALRFEPTGKDNVVTVSFDLD